ncbi:DUF3189 family protein [Bacillota bacterium LX-D]|nr:DUF3189 family protein [Bacillota bacterium LX-D]
MLVIYHDYGGTHSTVVAAWLHLKRLSPNKVPTEKDLMAIPLYDRGTNKDFGRIKIWGQDEWGNTVATLGRKSADKLLLPALQDLNSFLKNVEEIKFVNTMPAVNILMNIGGFTSRTLQLESIGRPIVIKGTIKAFPKLVQLVQDVRAYVKKIPKG